jgi:serine protease Do
MSTGSAEYRRRGRRRLAGLVLGVALGCGHPEAARPAGLEAAQADLQRLSQAFRAVCRQAQPAVVLVTTTRREPAADAGRPDLQPPSPPDEEDGLGSGILVSADGYVLSNHHVVEGAGSIRVTLADHRAFPAVIVGADSLVDIAVLKIEVAGVPCLQLARSRQLRIGDWVLALGHPLGMGPTLTHGIVCALGSPADLISDRYGIESFILTDAVINPGSSGGPLLDLHGEVVGINTAISTRTGYFMGYGLAIPVDLARKALDDILAYGRVRRGYLGIGMSAVTQELLGAKDLQLAAGGGLLLTVAADSPAARAGLRDGDVLLRVAGQEVAQPNQVQAMIYELAPGQLVTLQLQRGGRPFEAEVVLGEREDDRLLAAGRQRLEQLGLAIQDLSAQAAAGLGLGAGRGREPVPTGGRQPVRISAVMPGSLADARGLVAGDLITDIDAQVVTSVDGVLRQMAAADGVQAMVFWLWRPGQGVEVRVLPPPE